MCLNDAYDEIKVNYAVYNVDSTLLNNCSNLSTGKTACHFAEFQFYGSAADLGGGATVR